MTAVGFYTLAVNRQIELLERAFRNDNKVMREFNELQVRENDKKIAALNESTKLQIDATKESTKTQIDLQVRENDKKIAALNESTKTQIDATKESTKTQIDATKELVNAI